MKIIHTADNHLGAPLLGLAPQVAKARREELKNTFLRLLRFADEEGVAAVLIAGDLFDTPTPSPSLLREITDGIAACKAEVFYVTGNHDDGVSFPYAPSNFHRFDRGVKSYRLGEITVSGADYAYVQDDLLQGVKLDENTCNFFLLHGDLRQSFSYGKGKINLSALADKNIDYLALGHIHGDGPSGKIDRRGSYAYVGTLEGHGFDECGQKGFFLLEIGEGIRRTFVPFATRTYHEIEVALDGVASAREIDERVAQKVAQIPSKDGIKVRLKGRLSAGIASPVRRLQESLSKAFFAAKVEDESFSAVDFASFEGQKTLKGELVRLAKSLPDAEREEVLTIAFRALSGEDLEG